MGSRPNLNIWLQEITRALSPLGFRKRSGDTYTKDLADGILGTIGLGLYGAFAGEASVWPTIGVRHLEVERLLNDLRPWEGYKYLSGTIREPFASLMPGGKAPDSRWRFDRTIREPALADAFAGDIEQYGMPFLTANRTLDAIVDYLARDAWKDRAYRYRLPIALFLAGQTERAVAVMRSTLAEQETETHPAADEMREFGARFFERVAAGPPPVMAR